MVVPRDVRRELGQLIAAGFGGPSVPPDLAAIARQFDLGGIILFARNVEAPEQIAEIAHHAGGLARDLPLWVSVDQEGGRVARFRAPFTIWPPMAVLGRAGDDELTARFAAALAAELAAVGVTLDFAPVLDVRTNPANQVIGDRALAEEAGTVARLGRIIVETLQAHGVAACGKHFPGHGDTVADSHHELPVAEHDRRRLDAVELVPFRAAIEAGVAAILTAHVLYPALDEDRPATLSPRVVDGLLRRDLGFTGLVVTDDLDMKALAGSYTIGQTAVMAVAAGCDMLLSCGPNPDRHVEALESLVYALENGELPVQRVTDAIARQRSAKERFLMSRGRFVPRPETLAVVGSAAHGEVADLIARHA